MQDRGMHGILAMPRYGTRVPPNTIPDSTSISKNLLEVCAVSFHFRPRKTLLVHSLVETVRLTRPFIFVPWFSPDRVKRWRGAKFTTCFEIYRDLASFHLMAILSLYGTWELICRTRILYRLVPDATQTRGNVCS